MKGLSAGVRVAILFLLLAIAAYAVWKNLGQNPAGNDNQILFARFRDASGLPKSSKVVIAGLPKGQVIDLEVDGRYAKVTFQLANDIDVWSSAVVIKKATSLLGENYLEIDPGEQVRATPNGTKRTYTPLGRRCPDYDSSDDKKRDACRQIVNVIEATTPDQLLHRIEQTLPKVETVLDSVRDLSEDVRRVVNGPLNNVATRVDGLVQKEVPVVQDIIERADRLAKNAEALSDQLRSIVKNADPKVTQLLDNLDQASADAKEVVQVAKSELQQTGDKLRGKLDKIDGVIENTRSITQKIDSDTGTLGKLVNDPTIADNVEQLTEDAKPFFGTLFGLKTYVGLRSEYNILAGALRSYVSVELHTRPDKYYLIELEKGPRGDYPEVTLNFDPTVDPNHWIRKSVIKDEFRFTFQFAKRFSWVTLRYGIKESTGGVGADFNLHWWERELKLMADVFDATFDKYPRVKLALAYEVFRHVYVLGGIDELLNRPRDLGCPVNAALPCQPIVKGTSDVPIQFDTFHLGRDAFVGAMLRFNDEDLAALLTVGGAAIAGVAGK
jgi:phospholipid/cholesterol/gamma-HCH transport system substrate-binding protein